MKDWKGFERHVAKRIIHHAQCVNPKIGPKDCYRTPMSGGHPVAEKGDSVISPRLKKIFPFFIECKAYRDWNLNRLLWPKGKSKGWYLKLRIQAKEAGRLPIFIAKGNNEEPVAAVPYQLRSKFPGLKQMIPSIRYRVGKTLWVASTLEVLLTAVLHPDDLG